MSEKLPQGWVKTTFGEITEPSRTRALPTAVPDLQYVGLEHVEPQTMKLLGHAYGREARSSSVRFSKGDVLYGKMRPYLNKVWVAEFDGLCSAEFLVFPKRDALNNHFLALRLNAEDFVTFANGQVSGERPRIDFEKLSRFPILLPPLPEQNRIVEKLNLVLSGVERGETAARRAKDRLKLYHAAVLESAINGEFTAAWRETQQKSKTADRESGEDLLQRLLIARRVRWEEAELKRLRAAGDEPKSDRWKSRYIEPAWPVVGNLSKLPEEWTWATVGQLGEVRLGRQRSPEHHTGKHMRPYLRVANVFEDRIDTSDVKSMNFTPQEFEVYRLAEGDILLNEGQSLELVGRPAMFRNEVENCCFQNTLVRFRADDGMNRDYALIVFRAYLHNGQFQKIAKITTNLAHLGADRFARLEFPLPPSAEQIEIVDEVGRRLSAAGKLLAKLEQQLTSARAARRTLLKEAFSGLLTPQNPNDEPASDLLERLRADRRAEAQKPKAKRMPKSESTSKKKIRRPLLDVLLEHDKPMTPEQLFREAGYEHEFKEVKRSQEVVDSFYFELRRLTEPPAKVRQERRGKGVILLEVNRET
jgi:type I restriction enzyme, S subunit